MRILAVCNLFPPYSVGGNEIRFRQILEVLRQRHDVHVLTGAFDYGGDRDWVDRSLVQVVPYPKPFKAGPFFLARELWTSLRNYRLTKRAIHKFQPDIGYVSDLKRVYLGPPFALHRAGIPIVWDIADRLLLRYAHRKRIRKVLPLASLHCLSFDNSIVISEHNRQELIRAGVLPDTAVTINQGVELSRFANRKRATPVSPRKLLYVGSLIEQKGLHIVVKALGLLRERGTSHTLTVAGDSGDQVFKNRVHEIASSARVQDRITFLGNVETERMPSLYQGHDVFVFSSIWEEPFASTPLEAMACGVPVVGTLVGGQREFFQGEVNCLTYHKDDPRDLAAKILRLNDARLYGDIAARAEACIRENYSFSAYVGKIEGILSKAGEK